MIKERNGWSCLSDETIADAPYRICSSEYRKDSKCVENKDCHWQDEEGLNFSECVEVKVITTIEVQRKTEEKEDEKNADIPCVICKNPVGEEAVHSFMKPVCTDCYEQFMGWVKKDNKKRKTEEKNAKDHQDASGTWVDNSVEGKTNE